MHKVVLINRHRSCGLCERKHRIPTAISTGASRHCHPMFFVAASLLSALLILCWLPLAASLLAATVPAKMW